MKNMTVLIDTNVLIDFLLHRTPYDKDATIIMEKCAERTIHGFIAFHSVSNIFFILRKYTDTKTRRDMLKKLCKMVTVTAASHDEVDFWHLFRSAHPNHNAQMSRNTPAAGDMPRRVFFGWL